MKIKCINDNGFRNLTIGKIYEVIYDDKYDSRFYIKDNNNTPWIYHKKMFKTLSEIIKERNNKIDKLLR
jgi:pectate lyase